MNDTLYDTLNDKAYDIFLVFFCDTLHKKTTKSTNALLHNFSLHTPYGQK